MFINSKKKKKTVGMKALLNASFLRKDVKKILYINENCQFIVSSIPMSTSIQ